MTHLAELLGSVTRASVVEALAFGKKPLSAYRIAKMYNLNVPKVYLEVKRLRKMGLISAVQGRKATEYALNDEHLRTLATKLGTRTISYSEWRSPQLKAQRLRDGLQKVPKFSIESRDSKVRLKRTSRLDELDTLAVLARKKFDKKYRRVGEREYVRI